MKVRIEHAFLQDAYKIWFYRRLGKSDTVVVTYIDGLDTLRDEEYRASQEAEPSLVLRAPFLEALVVAASDYLPPSAATERHLTDAIAVRDKALDLLMNPRVKLDSGPRE